MDHIKNSPIEAHAERGGADGVSPALVLELQHPNDIADLTPWQIDFRQLDAGRIRTSVTVRGSSTMSVLNIAMTGRVHQRGASPSGWTTFGIPKKGTIKTWQGQDIAGDSLLAFGDRNGFDAVSYNGFSGNVVSFDTQRLEVFARACGFNLPGDNQAFPRMAHGEGAVRLRRLESGIRDLLIQSETPWSDATEEALLLDALTILLGSDVHHDTHRAWTRRRSLNRAIDLMSATLEEPVSISEICRQSGASWRTLDRAFNERFGMGPKTYYIRQRLNGVREELLSGSGTETVVNAANRHGFWHMGQFAREYRRFFGELPSHTRRGSD